MLALPVTDPLARPAAGIHLMEPVTPDIVAGAAPSMAWAAEVSPMGEAVGAPSVVAADAAGAGNP